MKSKYGFNSLLAFAILAFLAAAVPSFAASDNVTVTVNISSVAEITVLPTSLSWTTDSLGAITPGTDSATQNIVIKNTGSLNVSQIYLNASTHGDESTSPLYQTNATMFSSAGFIFVKNSTATSHYHAGRLEWNLSSVLTGETLGLSTDTTNFSHGWYRNASGNDYLWKLENGTNGYCNDTGTTFVIKTMPENVSSSNRNLSVNTNNCGGTVQAGGGKPWGTFPCTTGPLGGHCVATYYDCSKIYIYKYNFAGDFPTCSQRNYINAENLVPGNEITITVFASVPRGIPAGTAKQGVLTLITS